MTTYVHTHIDAAAVAENFKEISFNIIISLIIYLHVCDVKWSCASLASASASTPCILFWQTRRLSSSCFCTWSLCICIFCIGCECHTLPGAILPEGFEVIRSIEEDLSVLEILSLSVTAFKVCVAGFQSSAVLSVLVLPLKHDRT